MSIILRCARQYSREFTILSFGFIPSKSGNYLRTMMTKDFIKDNETKDLPKRRWRKSDRDNSGSTGQKKRKIKAIKKLDGGFEDILLHDVIDLLKKIRTENDTNQSEIPENTNDAVQKDNIDLIDCSLPKIFTEIQLEVKEISSTGDGLAIDTEHKQQKQQRIYVVPFSTPGDIVKAKVIKHHDNQVDNNNYTTADLISVIKAGPLRDDTRIKCKYFATCSGCQFQMMDYQLQLNHKKKVIESAYRNFSHLPQEMVPVIGDTIGSPLQYGYRTKLTPHFDAPKGYISKADRMRGVKNHFKETPRIGFNAKGANYTMDIEDCPIGTDAVRMGMKRERRNVTENIERYTKGATILLRESTHRLPNNETNIATTIPDTIKTINPDHIDFKSCVTDNRSKTTEYVDQFVFTNIANEFFQNNNSILPKFTQYIRDNILRPLSASTRPRTNQIRHLVDAYSGSGLFTITLSSLFESSLGIDISTASINSAQENARLNNLSSSQAKFMAADASRLFKEITFDPDETAVLIDPSRKGCDDTFISQLLRFGPQRIVYVSCNVHTQARDVGKIINGLSTNSDPKNKESEGSSYILESIIGFDFFPQTSHVESVAILDKLSIEHVNN
ncbi:tRNA (uracil(54)-C(5))-methyltransferase [Erysiphe necator]|uniref:Putative trna methyltransferase n=1 Tax=Uncinula necator TaxID=52586 RepID=A0A0B1PCQ1_UNCNE|nr:tRNA (uracil(54)-C(5))-methyltransferase [Erysiphe necator]KHJ35130.1 putative trna methyltransferase [Erysiphe necator]